MSARRRRLAALATVTLAGLGTLAPQRAEAQVLQRFTLRGELGATAMLADLQRDVLGYGFGAQGTLRLGFTLTGPLAAQVSSGYWLFPSDQGYGFGVPLTVGLRVEPTVGRLGRFFVDANVGLVVTGEKSRFGFDVGAGFEFALTRAIALGPMIRYGHIVADSANDNPTDAQYLSFGVSVALRVPPAEVVVAPPPPPPEPPPPPPPPDRDGDGVLDGDDACPTEVPGEHPDPRRAGCPAADSDGDGVFDHEDACATVAAGPTPDPSRRGCPDGDDDNDSVRNHADQCPQEPQGAMPDPTRAGCPASDRDNDAVPDTTDACPSQPGAPNPNPRLNGCPGLVLVTNGLIRINRPVFFANNSDVILPRSSAILQAVADTLRLAPQIRGVRVEGHTDNTGSPAHNMELSQHRAQSVVTWLTLHGVEAGRLTAQGFGPTRPLRPNITLNNRAMNRRVEFHITDPAPPASPAPRR